MRQLTVVIDEMTFLDLIAAIRILSREAQTRLWADESAVRAEMAYRAAQVLGEPILPPRNKKPGFGPG